MTVLDVYLLMLHEPYETPEHPVPINGTVVHARSLLHSSVPQPDGGLMYRCLTEFPGRTPGCLIPVSTLSFELDGGRLWSRVADWDSVVDAAVWLARIKDCDAMVMGLSDLAAASLAMGPYSTLHVIGNDYHRFVLDAHDRQEYLGQLTDQLLDILASGPFWPGDSLGTPPLSPVVMPYQPYVSQGRPRRSRPFESPFGRGH